MTTNIECEKNGSNFLWKVVNISQCWFEKNFYCESPTFISLALHSSEWILRLYPTWNGNMICIYLARSEVCKGPLEIDVKYRIDLMDKNGEPLFTSNAENKMFRKGIDTKGKGIAKFGREKIFGTERHKFLPEDTLTIRCTIWKNEETILNQKQVSAQTVFNVNRRFFRWKIQEFKNRKYDLKNKFSDNLWEFHLVLKNEGDYRNEEIALICNKIDTSIKYFSFNTCIKDTDGKKEDFGTREYFAKDINPGLLTTLLKTREVIDKQSLYLSGDALTLECECVYLTETTLHECCLGGVNSSLARNVGVGKRNVFPYEEEKPKSTLALAKDLKSMYSNKDFSDIELRTSTKTCPAHRIILSARSPVFRKMFSNNMKENNCGSIYIDDLEDDTLDRMLLYMYTDSLADLQFENACKLYVAADKYEILALRGLCSTFLKDTLCPSNACDTLVLADRHQDEDLKNAAQEFILTHDEVFGSQEWENLMAANLQLAADVMYRKLKPV